MQVLYLRKLKRPYNRISFSTFHFNNKLEFFHSDLLSYGLTLQEAAVDARQAVPPAPLLDVRHLDDIIRQQAIEIAGLRGQLTDSEMRAQRQVSLLESQLMLGDAHSTQQVAALEGKIRTLEETRLQLVCVASYLVKSKIRESIDIIMSICISTQYNFPVQ